MQGNAWHSRKNTQKNRLSYKINLSFPGSAWKCIPKGSTLLDIKSGCTITLVVYKVLCVRFTRLFPSYSGPATGTTLYMGGWLILTQPGLSPSKKHRASLGTPIAAIVAGR